MGSRPDPALLRQFAAALRPGAVLHLYQPLTGKHKFHAVITVAHDRSLGFIINSQPSPFIKSRPDLLRRQVAMLLTAHPFMKRDSVIACHDTVKMPTLDELIDRLIDRSAEHVGYVDRSLFGSIALAAAGSPTIAARDADLIARAFNRQADRP
jgi:hypothetical protein